MAIKANTKQSRSGVSILTVVGIVLVILKLTGVVTFSWLWVTAPFWGPFAVVAILLLGIGVGWLLTYAFFAVQEQVKNFVNRKKIAEAKERRNARLAGQAQERVSFHR